MFSTILLTLLVTGASAAPHPQESQGARHPHGHHHHRPQSEGQSAASGVPTPIRGPFGAHLPPQLAPTRVPSSEDSHAMGLPVARPVTSDSNSIYVTPHDKYSSSIGVLGCKIDTNRVAYWPMATDCDNVCVQVTNGDRSVYLLRIDQSGGAHDISYDAWNYLVTGQGAASSPTTGGGVAMQYQNVDASNCTHLLKASSGKLAFSAANSMNFISSCIAQPNSWVAKNHELYNIANSACTFGIDESCSLDLATSNQPSCPHQLGLMPPLTSAPVYDIQYRTGESVLAV